MKKYMPSRKNNGYVFLTDAATQKTVAINAKRVVNTFPSDIPGITVVDCGHCVGFEIYFIAEPLQTVRNKINTALIRYAA